MAGRLSNLLYKTFRAVRLTGKDTPRLRPDRERGNEHCRLFPHMATRHSNSNAGRGGRDTEVLAMFGRS
jgi:hypothetical protein